MIVYLVTNKTNEKQYIGQTVKTLQARWKKHLNSVDAGSSYYFHKAIRKHGKENFCKVVLHVCETKEEMDFVEMFYIVLLNTKAPNGYNSTAGGEGSVDYKPTEETLRKIIGTKRSEESKKKMSESAKGRKRTEASIKKTADAHRGTKRSEETKKKMSEAAKGRTFTPETRLKMSIAAKKRGYNGGPRSS
jgi:group I intron endonuclease